MQYTYCARATCSTPAIYCIPAIGFSQSILDMHFENLKLYAFNMIFRQNLGKLLSENWGLGWRNG
jgi:hypothetical protein